METATITETVVEVGDVFESSWGYDQTNVSFYEVVGFTPSGKSVRLRPIRKAAVPGSDGFMSRRVSPALGEFVGNDVITKLLIKSTWRGEGRWSVKFASYDYADLVKRDKAVGLSSYESWYA